MAMDRSLAGRADRPPVDPSPRRARAPVAAALRAGCARRPSLRAARPVRAVRGPRSRAQLLLRAPRRCDRRWPPALACSPVAGCGCAHSSLVAVEHVRSAACAAPRPGDRRGARSGRAADEHAATFDAGALRRRRRAVPRWCAKCAATASFPHGCSIRVIEQLPVAALTVDGARTAVAADGVVLGPALLVALAARACSVERLSRRPSTARARARRCWPRWPCSAPRPAAARRVARAYTGPKGLTVDDAQRAARLLRRRHTPARQVALARARAHRRRAREGASYVDVRLPERPAAGFSGALRRRSERARPPNRAAHPNRPRRPLAAGLAAATGSRAPNGAPLEAESSSGTSAEAAQAPPRQTAPRAPGEAAPDAATDGARHRAG